MVRASLWSRVVHSAQSVEEGLSLIDKETSVDEVVLPCAPTDEEKYSYLETHRTWIVGYGIVSCVPLCAGMWLFAFADVSFEFFTLPALLITLYLATSYFGVSVWGKDYDMEEHNRILQHAELIGYAPTVDVYLPCCGEPLEVLRNTYEHVQQLDYDSSKLNVYVLDDSASETIRALASMYGYHYIVRDDRPHLKKAGNLRNAFARTHGDIIMILDADFCPRSDMLQELVPHMTDPEVAIVQSPQFFRWRKEQTWVERAAGSTQQIFYRLVQTNRQLHDAAICVGTSAIYRRASLEPLGGTAPVGYSEDMHTGFSVMNTGWKVKYIPICISMGTCPDSLQAFWTQQYRWCMGSTTLCTTTTFWTSNLSIAQKACFCTGMLYYCATALSMFLAPLPSILLLIFKPSDIYWYNIVFALPSVLFPFVTMRLWSTQPYELDCVQIKPMQYLAHLYAIIDKLSDSKMPWIPTGGAGKKSSSTIRYKNAIRLLVNWTCVTTLLIWAGSAWRMQEYSPWNFIPTLLLESFNAWIALSALYE